MAQAVAEFGEVPFEIGQVDHEAHRITAQTVSAHRSPAAETVPRINPPWDQWPMAPEASAAANPGASVEIYTWRFCPFCVRAKALLDRKGVVYSEYCLDGDDVARRQMTLRAEGRSSLPQIFINNLGIGGCDELHALERRGELNALLGRQG